jgi:hypothetical protein
MNRAACGGAVATEHWRGAFHVAVSQALLAYWNSACIDISYYYYYYYYYHHHHHYDYY